MSEAGDGWQNHCKGIHIETIAHVYSLLNMILSSVQLLCYTVLRSALHIILEKQKGVSKLVCDMSTKTLEDTDDCELKASKIAAALLALSVFEVLLSFLALRGAYTQSNVYFCYIWFAFTGLLVIVLPLYQSIFFVGTNWWNAVSYSILSISIIHGVIKLIGMYIMMRFVEWIREDTVIQGNVSKKSPSHHNNSGPPKDPTQTWSLGEKSYDDSNASSTTPQNNDTLQNENVLKVEEEKRQ